MEWLNYHHLLYFHTVVQVGSVKRAAAQLSLSQPTVSAQIKKLEEALGEPLFERQGKSLILTEVGELAASYARDIFELGKEMVDAIHARSTSRPVRFVVGTTDVMPKSSAQSMLVPLLESDEPVHLVCLEGSFSRLLSQLANHELHMVLSDTPASSRDRVKCYNHLLQRSGVSFFGSKKLSRSLSKEFPNALDSAPLLLPTDASDLRLSLDAWFNDRGVTPHVVAECADSALITEFAKRGTGVCVVPSVNEDYFRDHTGLTCVGRTDEVTVAFYAITLERRVTHPLVSRILAATGT